MNTSYEQPIAVRATSTQRQHYAVVGCGIVYGLYDRSRDGLKRAKHAAARINRRAGRGLCVVLPYEYVA